MKRNDVASAADCDVFKSGNFSIVLHDFIDTLKFEAKRISKDSDVQIVEYHYNKILLIDIRYHQENLFLIDIKNAYAYNNIRGGACSSGGLTLKSDMFVNHVIDRWRTTLKSDIFTDISSVVGRQH